MHNRLTTRERILEASLKLFNENSYAATSLADIATEVGIARGNLTYHFATKKELALAHEERARAQARERRNSGSLRSSFVDSYVETIWFGLSDWWHYRFLYRDYAQYQDNVVSQQHAPIQPMNADIQKIHASLQKMSRTFMLRTGYVPDLQVLARSLFMVTRFWLDHLRETEGQIEFSSEDQRRGLEHHFAVLLPNLTAEARRKFEAALDRLVTGAGVTVAEGVTNV
jgi:AcrR family transcriptional regulator